MLVHSEQGFGDTLRFVRFVPPLAAHGGRVVLRVQDPLLPLLAGLAGADVVIGTSDSVPPFDYHCPLMSLPHALKTKRSRRRSRGARRICGRARAALSVHVPRTDLTA